MQSNTPSSIRRTTAVIRQMVQTDLQNETGSSVSPALEPNHHMQNPEHQMLEIPAGEVLEVRWVLRELIRYLKSPNDQLFGQRPVNILDDAQLKRLAWVYERRIKHWLGNHNELVLPD